MNQDTNGRPYAKLAELTQGDFIETDTGFDCVKAGKYYVLADRKRELFIACRSGRHYLSGQADDGIHCVGIYKVEGSAP